MSLRGDTAVLEAKKLMTHYFRLVRSMTATSWSSDNDAELEIMVDLIVEAAVIKAKESIMEGIQRAKR